MVSTVRIQFHEREEVACMDELETSRFSLSWTGVLALLSFFVAAWAAIQVGSLASALTQDPPSTGSRLVFEHHNQVFLYSLIFHAVAVVAFTLGGVLAGKAGDHINQMVRGARRVWVGVGYGAVYLLPTVALVVIFQVSNDNPRYQIYVEDSLQELIRMETRLIPRGVTEELVKFHNASVVKGVMNRSSLWGDRYFLMVVDIDGKTMQVGQGGRDEDPEALFPLARDIAESAGAELDLTR